MRELDPAHGRTGVAGGAEWILGQAASALRYRPIGEILAHLPEYMDEIQLAISEASDAIKQHYFPALAAPTWVGEGT